MAGTPWRLNKDLVVSVMRGHSIEAVRRLQAGANPNQVLTVQGRETVLLMQVQLRMPELVRPFLLHGAVAGVRDAIGLTPLHVVSDEDHVAPLVAAGAPVSAQDADGETPLHMARSEAIAQALVEAGGDRWLKCRAGRLPWEGLQVRVHQLVAAGFPADAISSAQGAADWLRASTGGTQMSEETIRAREETQAEMAARARERRI